MSDRAYWTVEQLAQHSSISGRAIREAISRGHLKATRPYGMKNAIRIHTQDADRWLAGEPPIEDDQQAQVIHLGRRGA